MSDAIFIVGYYRSGTSALSGALHRLGVALHNDADANEHNPLGFYEIPELIEFDVELFGQLGVEWTDIRGLPEPWPARADMAPFVARLEEILRRRFGAEPLWGLKHPHLCRLLPIYERAARQAGCTPRAIHIFRDPWTVAASQARKNSLSRAHALLLWAGYLVEAERRARHLPRAWVTYEDLLSKPAETLRRIGQDIGIDFCGRDKAALAAAETFLTGELNRSAALPKLDLSPPLRGLVEDMWDAVLARDAAPARWDSFGERRAEIVGFLAEIGASRGGTVLPGLNPVAVVPVAAREAQKSLRPLERTDEGAKRRLAARCEAIGELPNVAVLVAAPPRRAHAVGETLDSLAAQWKAPAHVEILSVDPVDIAGASVTRVAGESGVLTRALCARLNELAQAHDYVAILNAGDSLAPDAVLRFALAASQGGDLIYCDEVVPADRGPWVRHKPGWDVTRLRQSAYLGDWVWYRGAALLRAGGFDPDYAGVEEYDLQLRLAEAGAQAIRLPETLFSRAKLSRRDNIPATQFGPLALAAVAAHLRRAGIGGEVFSRAHLGLFGHRREVADPGTAILLLCDHADLAALDYWTKTLLSGPELSGPIILAGASLSSQVASYLTQVAQAEVLRGKVMAVPPGRARPDEALRRALALAATEQVAILDAGALPMDPNWLPALRARLADPDVAVASARTLVKLAKEDNRFMVQGPIIRGADTRLGAGHLADDPGPGGWLAVDQEAGAVAPGALLVRRAALSGCRFEKLTGDSLWIDLCAQIRAAGGKIVWTPDASFVARPESIRPDFLSAFRTGSPAARALPALEATHHPALSLRGDLLSPDQRFGLAAAAPADPADLLLSGPPEQGAAILNAARALRMAGVMEAGWAPEPFLAAEIARRAPSCWVRIDPAAPAPLHAPPHMAVFTRPPKPDAAAAIRGARQLFATSPAALAGLRPLAPGRPLTLWRPALSRPVWADFKPAAGLNTKPRLLWIDEGIAPAWLPELINATSSIAAWIVVERAEQSYDGAVARLRRPEDEQGWARELAALAPHLLVRPAGEAAADHYVALLAAAAGCHALADARLDLPEALGARRLPNQADAWREAVRDAVRDFAATMEAGQRARAACLALPAVEDAPPPWAGLALAPAARTAAE
jgi:GT2 family glycosyltransferase